MKNNFLKKLTQGLVMMLAIPLLTMCNNPEQKMDDNKAEAKVDATAGESKELMKRAEIDDKYKWDLTDLYADDAAWEADYKSLETMLPKIASFKGKLGNSAEMLLKYLKFEEELNTKFEKVHMYSSLNKDLDLKNEKYQGMYQRVMNLANQLSADASFIQPELLAIPDAKLKSFINSSPEMQHFSHYIDNMVRFKKYTLSEEEEKLMALAGPANQTFQTSYRQYTGADMVYPKVKDENGEEVQMSPARYYTAMTSKDRGYRERAYKAIYEPFMASKNLLSSNYNGHVQTHIFNAKARGYENSLQAALFQNNIPVDVYHNLVDAVNENLDPLQRWCSYKKKKLGVEKMHPYDTYVILFQATEKKYTPDEAMDLCLKALKPLGEEYIKDLKFAFDNRWVDFYETESKRSGAYSTGAAKGVHPYVLMNWGFTLNDVFTLAHEMGHNMHSWYTSNNQDFPYADYPIFVAEVASITNETLLMKYLIDNAETKEEKLFLIETGLNNIKGTFYRQTRFAQFEMEAHEMIEAGTPMTPDSYAKLFGDMYQKYWGPNMEVDEQERNSWPRIHHFYYNFYVYQYATSMAAAEALAAKMIDEGQPAIDKYLAFLKSGKTKYAIETLKVAGVDMTKKEPVLSLIKKANTLLDELEELDK
jgi:oligoendopeptidase F